MRITENRLRRIIRSVIKESMDGMPNESGGYPLSHGVREFMMAHREIHGESLSSNALELLNVPGYAGEFGYNKGDGMVDTMALEDDLHRYLEKFDPSYHDEGDYDPARIASNMDPSYGDLGISEDEARKMLQTIPVYERRA